MGKIGKYELRKKRAFRVRKKISGTAERPRMTVFRSNKNLSVQIIDDVNGKTLCAASSLEKGIDINGKNKVEISKLVGATIAEKAKTAGITNVVFDRNGFLYSAARIKLMADAARENGLNF
jgi:large subunit ribosomal protein L18